MSDRKTAAELRAMVPVMWTNLAVALETLTLHLAAVEEEREAEDAGDMPGIDAAIASARLEDVQRELEAMTRIADEQRERAKRAERERDVAARTADSAREAEKYAGDMLYKTTRELNAAFNSKTFEQARSAEHARLAADALRIGLEECERLRAERASLKAQLAEAEEEATDFAQQAAELDAMTRDREKTREYWELWSGRTRVAMYQGDDGEDAESVRRQVHGDKGPDERVVHVTRWRKKP